MRTELKGPRKAHALLLTALLGLVSLAAGAQVSITGRVTGRNGEGLPGISVIVRGQGVGTMTDGSGNYALSASLPNGNQVIDFTGTGYKPAEASVNVTAGTASYRVDAKLDSDALGLEEVVVTGTSLGTTKKQLGNFIATVKSDVLTRSGSPNVLAALQGKTPGAQIIQNTGDPGGSISVRLRGVSTISSSSEPLYIIDGTIVSNSARRVTNTQSDYGGFISPAPNRLVDINPADIERIEVLNGAAAAAIYGSRANAGVVQIFTKRGSTGAPVVNVSTNVMVSQLRKGVGYNSAPTKFGGPTDGPLAQTQDILTLAWPGTTSVTRYNYWDYIFQNAVGTDNNVSVRGGKDKTKYFASASYLSNQGIIKNTDFKRFGFRMNLDQELAKWASLNIGLNYINSRANEKPDGNSFYSPINSVTIIGNFHDIWKRDNNGNLLAVGERGRVNPVSVIEDIQQAQETNRIISSMGLKLKPFRDFTVDYTMGIDNLSQNGQTYIPPFAYNASPGFWGGGLTLDPTLNGYASTGSNQQFLINHELNGTLNKRIGKDIVSTTQLGYSVQYERGLYAMLQGRGMAPLVRTVQGASTVLPGSDERSEISITGTYLQQNFKFRNKLFLTGAVRMDGSSVFGVEQRNQTYLKFSGSYVVSDEDFWKKSVGSWWDYLKIRAAYGESGNLTGIGAYSRFNIYQASPLVGRTSLISPGQLANENVKPETQKEVEIGADMSFVKGRVNLTVNVYDKKVEDLLISRFINPTQGYTSLLGNVGSLTNKGFEVALGLVPVQTKDLTWNVDIIYNRNRNKVVNTPQGLIQYGLPAGSVSLLPGYGVGVFYGFFFARDNNGNELKNSAGIPLQERGTQTTPSTYTTTRDAAGLPTGTPLRKVIGDPNPDWTGTLTNTVSWKRLYFRMQMDAIQGFEVFNADFRTRQGVGNGKEFAEKEHLGQIPRGYISTIYAIEEWRIDDGSFVKLRELSLSYDFGRVNKSISGLTLTASGRNLYSWDSYRGFDPETNAGGGSTLARGIDFGNVPIPRTFALTLNAKF